MQIKPVEKQSLSNQVFNQIRDFILNEQYRPGDKLPSERELCDLMQINRSSVREALKRLEQARLIEIRHGEGSVVLDFKYHGGFDLIRHMVEPGKPLNYLAIRSLCEVRSLVCTEIARLAALRIKEPELEELAGIVGQMKICVQDGEGDFQSLDFEFHYTLAKASENVAFLLMLNSIREVYLPMAQAFSAMFTHVAGDPGVYEDIYQAVKGGDSQEAGNLTHQLIEEGNRIFMELHEKA
ncbi:FadR/GntR family transcriptional regulator [Desulfatibacillum aliphaticivorans]|uniref:Regulatory protein GntR HTH n=1 Tax=Desulfatibacillum aliphaticivorans TaxID=218208 RepID=B8FKP4_DESAL|nr:FadR/GntR family transcriptional regulator [Desulfatibacillum aliphaticivorans]ACL04416.1 regulatory protein GntR HTH [Desulfatibacillum aliphaticivorans]